MPGAGIKASLKPVSELVSQFYLFFYFCFALITDVFLDPDICLCGNNVEIAVEINFLFIGLSLFFTLVL